MKDRIAFLQSLESCVNVENVTLQLLLNGAVPDSVGSKLSDLTTHRHSYTELFFCQSGEIEIETESSIVTLDAGDAAIVPAQLQHCKRSSPQTAKWVTVGFTCTRHMAGNSRDLYARLQRMCGDSGIQIWRNMPELFPLMCTMDNSGGKSGLPLPALSLAQILILLSERYAPVEEATQSERFLLPEAADTDIRRMAILDHLINSCFENDFSDSEIARCLFVSQRQLSRIVQKWYGDTLRRVIAGKRISAAAQLLQRTDLSTERIGQAVGFPSQRAFTREFMRIFGKTPASFRRGSG